MKVYKLPSIFQCEEAFFSFTFQDVLCFCHNVTSLFEIIGIACRPNEWHLFIDSSSRSLRAVLLHNGNKYPSLPLAHSVHLKEEYNSVKALLDALKYDEYGWEVIGNLKIVTFLLGYPRRFYQVSLLSLSL